MFFHKNFRFSTKIYCKITFQLVKRHIFSVPFDKYYCIHWKQILAALMLVSTFMCTNLISGGYGVVDSMLSSSAIDTVFYILCRLDRSRVYFSIFKVPSNTENIYLELIILVALCYTMEILLQLWLMTKFFCHLSGFVFQFVMAYYL